MANWLAFIQWRFATAASLVRWTVPSLEFTCAGRTPSDDRQSVGILAQSRGAGARPASVVVPRWIHTLARSNCDGMQSAEKFKTWLFTISNWQNKSSLSIKRIRLMRSGLHWKVQHQKVYTSKPLSGFRAKILALNFRTTRRTTLSFSSSLPHWDNRESRQMEIELKRCEAPNSVG